MEILHQVFVQPFLEMGSAPDLLVQVIWEGFVSGILYSLIALGFVLIFKASGIFNFAQGIMVVFRRAVDCRPSRIGCAGLAWYHPLHRDHVRAGCQR